MCEGGALPRESGAQTACRWGWGGDFCSLVTVQYKGFERFGVMAFSVDPELVISIEPQMVFSAER